nr:prolipoprotein diacylglyceryl transferase [Salsipaludibacter albus]
MLAQVPYHTFPDFQLGPLTIRTFGLMVALGIILGVVVAARYVANRGIDPDEYTSLATKVAIVGLIGARVTWVLSHLEEIQSPIDVIAVWEGGMQFSGALIFGAIATWWWSRGNYDDDADRWAVLDGTALGVAIGLCVGRIGCMAVGEHFGGPTDFFLGMTYRGGGTVEPEPAIGETIHNTAFYEFLHLLVLLAVIAVLLRRAGDRNHPLVPGTIMGLFLTWYGIGRFLTDFARTNDATVAGLTGAQWGSIVIALLGTWILATGSRRADRFAAQAMPPSATQPQTSNVRVLPEDAADDEPGERDAEASATDDRPDGPTALDDEPHDATPDVEDPDDDTDASSTTSPGNHPGA